MIRKGERKKGKEEKKTPVLSYGKYWGQKEKKKKKEGKKLLSVHSPIEQPLHPKSTLIITYIYMYIFFLFFYTFSPRTSLIPDLAVPLNTLANTDSILLDILLDPGSVESIVPVCVLLDRIHLLQGGSDIVREDHSHPGDVSNRQGAVRNRRVRAKHDASKDRSPIARIPYEAKRRYSYMYISHQPISKRGRKGGGTCVSQATRPWLHISRVGTSTRLVYGRGHRAGRVGRRGCTRGCSRPRTFSLLRRSRGRGGVVVCRALSQRACRRRSP